MAGPPFGYDGRIFVATFPFLRCLFASVVTRLVTGRQEILRNPHRPIPGSLTRNTLSQENALGDSGRGPVPHIAGSRASGLGAQQPPKNPLLLRHNPMSSAA